MGLQVYRDVFTVTTGAIGTTYARSGYGFAPKAAIIILTNRTSTGDSYVSTHLKRSFGFARNTGTNPGVRNVAAAQSEDGSNLADADHGCRGSTVAWAITVAGATDGLLDLDTWDSDGMTFIVDDVFTATYVVTVLAFGGDITVAGTDGFEPDSPGNLDVDCGSGFGIPDVVFFWGSGRTQGATIVADSNVCFGAATIDGATVVNAVWHGFSDNAQGTMVTRNYCRMGDCIGIMNTDATTGITMRAHVLEGITDGFRMTWDECDAALNRGWSWLAIKGGKWKLASGATRTDGNDIAFTGLGGTCIGGVVASACAAEHSSDTPAAGDQMSLGLFTGTAARHTLFNSDQDGAGTSVCYEAIQNSAIYARGDHGASLVGLMDVKSLDSDGATYVMDDVDPDAAFFWTVLMASGNPVISGFVAAAGRAVAALKPQAVLSSKPVLRGSGAKAAKAAAIIASSVERKHGIGRLSLRSQSVVSSKSSHVSEGTVKARTSVTASGKLALLGAALSKSLSNAVFAGNVVRAMGHAVASLRNAAVLTSKSSMAGAGMAKQRASATSSAKLIARGGGIQAQRGFRIATAYAAYKGMGAMAALASVVAAGQAGFASLVGRGYVSLRAAAASSATMAAKSAARLSVLSRNQVSSSARSVGSSRVSGRSLTIASSSVMARALGRLAYRASGTALAASRQYGRSFGAARSSAVAQSSIAARGSGAVSSRPAAVITSVFRAVGAAALSVNGRVTGSGQIFATAIGRAHVRLAAFFFGETYPPHVQSRMGADSDIVASMGDESAVKTRMDPLR